ncbi:hypothetical protein ACFX19_043879 [Malus domestica]
MERERSLHALVGPVVGCCITDFSIMVFSFAFGENEDHQKRPVLDRARGGRMLAELRGGQEPFADADEAVRRRGAELVAELLGAGAEVPAADAGFDG